MKFRLPHLAIILILLFAFALRIYAIDAQPLRGDEAFAVRYWAQPPAVVLETLAWIEPHPYATFFGFWAWKSLAGEGELAMRLLPALLNLLGAAGIYALALRLRMGRAAALLAALLWSINPNLIWHSQDARNYAVWAGMSVIALWLLLRALERNRRLDWLLYILIEALTLYIFFLEAFLLVVHGVLALAYWRKTRHASRITYSLLLLLLLLPWLYQVYRLAGSGYGGTAAGADVSILLRDFVPELLFGERLSAFGAALPGALVTLWVLAAALLWWLTTRTRAALLALLLLIVPPLLLFIVATRVDVFRPRYVIAITPALVLLLASLVQRFSTDFTPQNSLSSQSIISLHKRRGDVNVSGWTLRWASLRPVTRVLTGVLLLVTLLVGCDALETYYTGGAPKSPDWRALGSYLEWNTDDADAVVLIGADDTAAVDPAFMYYYSGAFDVLPQPGADMQAAASALLAAHESVYLVHAGIDPLGVEAAFAASAQAVGGHILRGFRVMVFPGGQANAMLPLDLAIGGGRLAGWRMIGVPRQEDTIWLLLDWSALPETRWKTFVHLRNNDGAVVAQADHYPTQPQDVYALSLMRVPAGSYMLHIGLYDETTGERAPIVDMGDPVRVLMTDSGAQLAAFEVAAR